MIIRVSFLVIASASLAVFKLSRRFGTSSIKISENEKEGSSILQIEEKFMDNFSEEEVETTEIDHKCKPNPNLASKGDWSKKLVTQREILQSLVKELDQRKMTLEAKFHKLSNLEQKGLYITELRRDLEVKKAESDMLKIRIHSLKTEINEIQQELEEGLMAKIQLEMAMKMNKEMKMKMKINGELVVLKERISGFENGRTDSIGERKVKALNDFELKAMKMRRRNKELELEKRDLICKLAAAQGRITSISETSEGEIISEFKDEIYSLKHANERLSNQIERLQTNRFSMVEELVYQRWVNTCLRLEIQHHKNPPRNPSNFGLSKNSSNASHIFSDYSNDIFETSSSSTATASSQRSITSKNTSLIQKIKQLARTKSGRIRRFSTSDIPSRINPSTERMNEVERDNIMRARKEKVEEYTKFPETTSVKPSRRRRVSFSDCVRILAPTEMCDSESKLSDGSDSNLGGKKEIAKNEEVKVGLMPNESTESDTKMEHFVASICSLFILVAFFLLVAKNLLI